MPLILHNFLEPEGEVAVWRTDELVSDLIDQLILTESENSMISKMSDQRLKEWASARWLVHILSGRKQRGLCLKDEFGKPYLVDSPYQISISHSLDHTAVIAAPYAVGIDVQEIVPKMERISKKFVNEMEWKYLPENPEDRLEMLHIIWGTKEAMYKAWGKKKIDFRAHLNVPSFRWVGQKISFTSSLEKANIRMNFNVIAEKVDNYILVYVHENSRYVS